MKFTLPLLTVAGLGLSTTVSALPSFAGKSFDEVARGLDLNSDRPEIKAFVKRAEEIRNGGPIYPRAQRGDRDITALINPATFKFNDEEQSIDLTSDEHKFIAPGPNDIRGPCPGLNLLANHGYLDRSGVTTLTQGIDAINKVFGVGPDLALALNAYAVIFNGNILDGTWSIGGPYKSKSLGSLTNLLFGDPAGINAHNVYEGDASIVRQDLYDPASGGNNVDLHMPFYEELLADGGNNSQDGVDVFTPEVMLKHKSARWHYSVANNPRFFQSAFGGLVVTTAAERFVTEFAANNTADAEGYNRIYLDEKNLHAFFGIYKENGKLVYKRGQERLIPGWKRRPLASSFSLVDIALTLLAAARTDPSLLSFGGNTGTVNSFAGLDVGDLSGGVFNLAGLLKDPQELLCFLYQAGIEELVPTQLNVLYKSLGQVTSYLSDNLKAPWSKAANSGDNPCRPFDQNKKINILDAYKKFPGAKGVPGV
ncbi:hypothetical protein IE81DRAFT_346038 [Ceraceosorus guamensis]|uniref:Heme haloperoxidase family profile domain-containing protein n=1 Tax=Ceraceosorus guamensis TaxID=1522189 RepID=A0A316W5V2_9BASI|nr:hypothetical protein IE81DRAFT_346038 [Ceraceosorus guamensis]PWN44101.1 hypothetical protein IE81DRAFT_346038 [Ceraceosorus guamensis]